MKTIKLILKHPFSEFVSLFNNKTKDFLQYINVHAYSFNGWGAPQNVLNYSMTCSEYTCQWASPNYQSLAYLPF